MKSFRTLFLAAVVLATTAGYARGAGDPADMLVAPATLAVTAGAPMARSEGNADPALSRDGLVFGQVAPLVLGADNVGLADVYSPALAVFPAAGALGVFPPFRNTMGLRAVPVAAQQPLSVLAATGGAGAVEQFFPVRRPDERSGWTLLLCSFVVVGFIAQRKARLVAG